MNQYNQHYNKENVFIRNMVVALLAELNKKLCIYNQLDNNTTERVNIPCMYSITGGERFLQDEFVYGAIEAGKAIGDYEPVPRCMIQMNGVSVNAAEQTNKYIHTKIVREVKGVLRTCYLNTDMVPLTLVFDAEVICSNLIEMMKVTECLISRVYKNHNLFNVDFGMFNTEATFTVPQDYQHEKPTEFGLTDKKEYKVTFAIEMKSFLPCFEHGLLLSEIDEMLSTLDNDQNGLIEFRPNEYGVMEMRIGGVLSEFESGLYDNQGEATPGTSLKSDREKWVSGSKVMESNRYKAINKGHNPNSLLDMKIVK